MGVWDLVAESTVDQSHLLVTVAQMEVGAFPGCPILNSYLSGVIRMIL